MNKRRNKTLLLSMVLIASLLLMGRVDMAFAADMRGSITIDYHVTVEQEQKIFPTGVPFIVYQIGNFRDGAGVLNDEFQRSGVSLADASASGRNRQAKELYAYARREALAGTTVTTKDGKAEVGNIDAGIYLIAQTERYSYAQKGWFASEPFLLSVPLEVNGEWTDQVRVEPKTAYEPIQQPEHATPNTPDDNTSGEPTPHTGDEAHLAIWFAVAFASASVLYLMKKRKREDFQ